jgi:hypothetical protein
MTAPSMVYEFVAYQVSPDSPQLANDFLCLMSSLAAKSPLPYSVELQKVAKNNNILPLSVSNFQTMEGRGIGGLITIPSEHHPRAVMMGTYDLLIQCGLKIPELLETTYRKWSSEPDMQILVGGWDQWVRGIIKFKT